MDIASRRKMIMLELYRNRRLTIAALARMLGVSTRTVRRDIEALSLTEPIYTVQGRYGGGVYLMDGAKAEKVTITLRQYAVIYKVISAMDGNVLYISDEEKEILLEMLSQAPGGIA